MVNQRTTLPGFYLDVSFEKERVLGCGLAEETLEMPGTFNLREVPDGHMQLGHQHAPPPGRAEGANILDGGGLAILTDQCLQLHLFSQLDVLVMVIPLMAKVLLILSGVQHS